MTERGRRFWLAVLLIIGILPFELNGWYNPLLSRTAFWYVEFFTWVIMPAAIVFVALRARLVTIPELGFHSRIGRWRSEPLVLLCIVIATFAMYHLDH